MHNWAFHNYNCLHVQFFFYRIKSCSHSHIYMYLRACECVCALKCSNYYYYAYMPLTFFSAQFYYIPLVFIFILRTQDSRQDDCYFATCFASSSNIYDSIYNFDVKLRVCLCVCAWAGKEKLFLVSQSLKAKLTLSYHSWLNVKSSGKSVNQTNFKFTTFHSCTSAAVHLR